jgi:hypothetical protein
MFLRPCHPVAPESADCGGIGDRRRARTGRCEGSIARLECKRTLIAKEAYVYGFPLADRDRVQYSYFVDRSDYY